MKDKRINAESNVWSTAHRYKKIYRFVVHINTYIYMVVYVILSYHNVLNTEVVHKDS